ncbi:MAG: DUF1232 domain-containing protein [Deltaproteobacteria bacterium]|nr:DUF1232 domain-containing protein [Deltaproteobacteria bacterium]
MTEINDKCLEVFPNWLRTLDEDVKVLFDALLDHNLGDEPRRFLTGGINYLFKSLDLIPDGIDDIGYMDDAFVLRLAAKSTLEGDIGAIDPELLGRLGRLANDAELIREFLGPDTFARLDKYTRDLRKGAARGRTVDEIMEDATVMREFSAEVVGFIKDYKSPGFTKDEKNLIKLKAFFEAKLPK